MTDHQAAPGSSSEPKGDGPVMQVVDKVGRFLAILFCSILVLIVGGAVLSDCGARVRPNQGLVRTAEETGLALSALADGIPQGQIRTVRPERVPGEPRQASFRKFFPGEPNPPTISVSWQAFLLNIHRFFDRTHDIRWVHTIRFDPVGIEQQLSDPLHQVALDLVAEMKAVALELGWTERSRWEGDIRPGCGLEIPFPRGSQCRLESVSFSREDQFGTWSLGISAHCGGHHGECSVSITISSPTVRR